MKRFSKFIMVVGVIGVGTAIACTELPIPPLPPLKVNLDDISKERAAGSADPLRSAFNKKLDSAAEQVMGSAAWRANYFKGQVSYTTKLMMMTGRAMVYVEKPCGQSAEEAGNSGQVAGGTGSVGGSGSAGIGGWIPGGGGCYGYCEPPYGKVGELEQA